MIKAEEILSTDSLQILEQFDESVKSYMKWFLAFTEIPRPSLHCERVSQQIFDWCTKNFGIQAIRDDYGNIYAQIPSNSKEDLPVLAFQAHMDVVLAGHYVNDKVQVKVRDEGSHKIIYSDTSTLGADNGFGLALMLDIIEKRNTIKHPPLEFIFTVDEEIGLVGASKLKPNVFKYKYLINCDSLDNSQIFIGVAGAKNFEFSIFPELEPIPQNQNHLLFHHFYNKSQKHHHIFPPFLLV